MDGQLTTPFSDGFRMPGEHEPHDEVWLAWPLRTDNWRNNATPAQETFAEVARAISASTPVTVVVPGFAIETAKQLLPDEINVVEGQYNDSWMRDIGATYLVNANKERRAISWRFNAWGGELDGLYDDWQLDDAIASTMASMTGDNCYQAPLVLEGGSIHSDGDGTIYTTEECLLHPSRNPNLTKKQIENYLMSYLGAEKVIWLPLGLFNDETNGHVDNIMHVVKPGEVLLTWCDDPTDPQYAISRKAFDVLSTELDAKGRRLIIHKLPLPGPLYITDNEAQGIAASKGMKREAGERLAASYANFLISNQQVIYPKLDVKTDKMARDVLANAFPDHELVGIEAREIALGGGNIHCITQQVPATTT